MSRYTASLCCTILRAHTTTRICLHDVVAWRWRLVPLSQAAANGHSKQFKRATTPTHSNGSAKGKAKAAEKPASQAQGVYCQAKFAREPLSADPCCSHVGVSLSLSHCQMMTPLPLALWFHWPLLLPFPTCGTGLITIAAVTSTYQSTSHTRHPPPRSHTSICLCQGLRRLVLVSAHCGDTLLPWCGLCWPSSHEEPQGGCCVGLGRAPHRARHRSCSHTSVRPPACRPSS